MTSPALGVGNTYYIISRGATHLEFCKIRVLSKMRKVIKFGTYKFNTIGII